MEIFIKSILWLIIFMVTMRLYKKQIRLPEFNESIVLTSVAGLYAGLIFWGLFFQHASFNTFAKDLSIYIQALGSWKLYSPILGRSLLAGHFSPLLFLLVPIGKIFNSPYLLFILQGVILVLPIFPIHRIARRFGLDQWPALLMVFIYLNFYYSRNIALGDFHVELFMPLFFLMLIEAFLASKSWPFWAWMIACLAIKEDVGFYLTAWFGILSIVLKEHRKRSLMAVLICFVFGIFSITSLLPFNKGVYPHFDNWQQFGNGLFGIIFGILLQPIMTVLVLFKSAFAKFLLPLLTLPLFTIWGWAALPVLWIQLASNNVLQNNLDLYYAAPVIPFFIIALIAGWKKVEQWSNRRPNGKQLLIALAVFLVIFNFHWIPWQPVKKEHRQLEKILNKMPGKGRIYAQANIAPHIKKSQRVRVLGMNSFKEKPDVIIFHVKGHIWPFTREQYLNAINKIKFNTNYKLWKNQAGAQIYIRNSRNK